MLAETEEEQVEQFRADLREFWESPDEDFMPRYSDGRELDAPVFEEPLVPRSAGASLAMPSPAQRLARTAWRSSCLIAVVLLSVATSIFAAWILGWINSSKTRGAISFVYVAASLGVEIFLIAALFKAKEQQADHQFEGPNE